MATVKKTFEDTIKTTVDGFCANFSHQLSDWLRENKDVEVSPEELCVALNVPYRPPSTPGMNGSSVQTVLPNVMPQYFSSASSPSAAAGKKKGGRSKTADPNRAKCEYKLTRGKTPGASCPNTVSGDGSLGADKFCAQCLKKSAVKKQLENMSSSTTVQPPQMPGASVAVETESEDKNGELQVVEIPGRTGWFRETVHNFAVFQENDGSVVAHGVLCDNGTQRNLTDAEKKTALSLGLQIVNTVVNIPVPSVPKSSLPAIPTIPNAQLPKA